MASISNIDGISARNEAKLATVGIRTSDELLEYGATKKGRKELSTVTGLGEKRILEWVRRADLLRVKGIHVRYSDLLEAVGIDSSRDLRRRSPRKLLEQMQEVNVNRNVVTRLPSESEVQGWIDSAKTLKIVIR